MSLPHQGRNNLPGPVINGRFIVTPPTTDMALVFPFDQRKNKFDRNFYAPVLTDGKISSEHLELFLRDAEDIIKKKVGRVRTLFKVFTFWVIAGIFTMLLLAMDVLNTIDIDFSDSDDDIYGDDDIDVVCFTIFGYFIFVVFVSLLLCKFHKRSQNKARKSIQRLIDNKYSMFSAQGLRWSMPLHFPHWIELWKDYKGQNNYVQQGPQMYAPYALTMPNQVVPQQFHNQVQSQTHHQVQPPVRPQYQTNFQFIRPQTTHEQRSGLSQPLLSQQPQEVNLYPQLGGQN